MQQNQSVSLNPPRYTGGKVGIIAGQGYLPRQVAISLTKRNIEYCYVDLSDQKDLELDHKIFKSRFTASGKIMNYLKSEKVEHIVFAGKIPRPNFYNIWPDFAGLKLLLQIIFTASFSDDRLFRKIIKFCESRGFKVIGIDEVAPEILTPKGILSNVSMTPSLENDIHLGFKIAKATGLYDIGQAVIIKDHLVIGVEAVEGTDNLIKRCIELKNNQAGGVLVKVSKPQQDTRIDLPTIGPDTIKNLAEGGYTAVGLEADKTLIVNYEETIRLANEHKILVVGL